MDEAERGPGPRDPEIPQEPGVTSDAPTPSAPEGAGDRAVPVPSDGDWTSNLTTISVVAPKPRRESEPGAESEPESESEPAVDPVAEPDASDEPGESDGGAAVAPSESAPESLPLPRRRGDDSAAEADVQASESPVVPAPASAPEGTADTASDARLKSLVAAWVAASDDEPSDDEVSDGEVSDEGADSVADSAAAATVGEATDGRADEPADEAADEAVGEAAVDADAASPSDVPGTDVAAMSPTAADADDATGEASGDASDEASEGPADGPAAADPDTALLSPVEPAGGPDTALLKPVGESGAKGADLDSWVASLGERPREFADKPAESAAEAPAEAEADGEAKETVPARRRFINPWLGGAAVVALLLAGAAAVENPFTIATAERVPVSDVPRMSDPEPDQDDGPVNGGLPENLELPPLLPAAAPGASVSPSPSVPASSAAPFTLPPQQSQTPASTVTGSNGIPQIVLAAYKQAAEYTAKADPKCRLPWELLAAIGRVESGHANGGQVSTAGTALTPILGPRLDGTRSTKAIRDTDKGVLDFDTEFDRAVGPMQFIPTSWKAYAMDGNKDGKKDPQNVYDATLTAARYLCAGDRDLSTEAGLDKAIFSYNQSPEYVRSVKAWTVFYRQGVRPVSVPPPQQPATSTKPPAPPASKSPTPSKSASKAPATTTPASTKTPSAPAG